MNNTTNSLNWFEIPATDIVRAKKFYEAIFNLTLETMEMGPAKMEFFPSSPESGKVSGSLVQSPDHTPSTEGAKIYLNANPDLSVVIDKVEAAGGKVLLPKTQIGEFGYMGFILDTEGNNIGLHSNG